MSNTLFTFTDTQLIFKAMLKTIIRLLLLFLLIAGGIWLWEQYKFLKNDNAEAPEVSHNILLQEITSMGKIELVKYNFRDVVESKIKKNFLPDAKVLLIVTGEATGCIDLTKIKVADLQELKDTVVVHLPEPEICNYKIDHSKSKVYDTQYAFMDEAKLVDEAFQKAEAQVQQSAQSMGILEQTKESAEQMLKPFIEKVSGKKVVLKYAMKDSPRRLK
ncbi:DUF4230 domain-containing protein [Flectobacillus roseus]|uniref:DUF4230 domain-containing protein n=1 Tax=Flectobacillus roseus TaxID=502259 RepID=A0ABT6YB61_9BACT|nr:DUF4230 domain-containing protein [Flectobacillus roseus]MDI9860694.1 DUF4230 domain-containing protein [Flectobacillus roseus]